jgi:hypothetical protein
MFMEWVVGLIVVAVTALVFYQLGKNQSPAQQKIEELENAVVNKDAELQRYKQQVTEHFQQTAHLFGKVTQEYQALYQHMANSSQFLVGAQPFKNALENQNLSASVNAIYRKSDATDDFRGEDTFSNEHLYRAHEYRNRPEQVEDANEEDDIADNVIHLDKGKEDTTAPPLDYAVKEKGVINHNSLNMENVKT